MMEKSITLKSSSLAPSTHWPMKLNVVREQHKPKKLVHPILKRGHSNAVEASHNVLIRFRSKDVFLERLHYQLSTNLGLLQANLTYMHDKFGTSYHWIVSPHEATSV